MVLYNVKNGNILLLNRKGVEKMKALVCEMCNSTDMVKQDGFFVCQHCGMKYSPEDAKKMMVEGTVKIDTSGELENLYQVARRAKEDNNDETAGKYYDMILAKDPTSWEASFYTVYFRSKQCKIAHIASVAVDLANCQNSVMALIRNYVKNEEEQLAAVKEIVKKNKIIATTLFDTAVNFYNGTDLQIRHNYVNDWVQRTCASRDIMYFCGNAIEKNFAGNEIMKEYAASAWMEGLELDALCTEKRRLSDIYKAKIEKSSQLFKRKFVELEIRELQRKSTKASSDILTYSIVTGFWVLILVGMYFWGASIDHDIKYVPFALCGILAIFAIVCALKAFKGIKVKKGSQKAIEDKKKEIENHKAEE